MSAFSVFTISSIFFYFLESIIFVKGVEKSSLSGLLVSDTSGLIKVSSEGLIGRGDQKSSLISVGDGVSGKTSRILLSLLLLLMVLLSAKRSNSAFISANLTHVVALLYSVALGHGEVPQVFSLMAHKHQTQHFCYPALVEEVEALHHLPLLHQDREFHHRCH